MLDTATTRDTFNMKKTSSQMSAMGHGFGPDNTCACGKTWEQQRESPTVCPKLMARLEELERMDRVLQQMSSRVRRLEEALADALASSSVENTLEHILRHLIQIETERKAKEKKSRGGKDGKGT